MRSHAFAGVLLVASCGSQSSTRSEVTPPPLAHVAPADAAPDDGITLLASAPADALELSVDVRRWSCDIHYPDDIITPELHVPIGRAVHLAIVNDDLSEDLDLSLAGRPVHLPRNGPVSLAFRIDHRGTYAWDCPTQKPPHASPADSIAFVFAQTPDGYAAYLAAIEKANQSDLVAFGAEVFAKKGCIACHSIDGSPRVGVTMANLWGTSSLLESGQTRVVDDALVRDSLVKPKEVVRKGYPVAMPNYDGNLTEREIRALTRYIESLGTPTP